MTQYTRNLIESIHMTHIDIARKIRYRLLAELHRSVADLYAEQNYGSDAEIRAVVEGFESALGSLYAYYNKPAGVDSLADETGSHIKVM